MIQAAIEMSQKEEEERKKQEEVEVSKEIEQIQPK